MKKTGVCARCVVSSPSFADIPTHKAGEGCIKADAEATILAPTSKVVFIAEKRRCMRCWKMVKIWSG